MKSSPRTLMLAAAIACGAAGTAAGQNLTVTDGLQLWLKADAGTTVNGAGGVLTWLDQTANHNDAVANDDTVAPELVAGALNAKPVVRFDGEDDHLLIADSDSLSFTGDLTTFFVVRFSDFATYRAVWAKTVDNFPAPTDWYALPNSGIPRLYRGSGSGTGLGFNDGVALKSGSYLTVGFDLQETTVNHYLAGQRTAGGNNTAVVGDGDTPMIIGSRADGVTKMKGDIAEIVIYDRALTDTERDAVVTYLGQKYAIQNLPPTVTVTTNPVGPTVPVGTTVTLTAAANDPDGSIARVEFLVNGTRVATASTPPYSAKIRLDTPSNYAITARAVDEKDATGTSLPKALTATEAAVEPVLDVTTGLQLWLKADAGVTLGGMGEVTSWNDQSGKANHASQADPNTSPAVAAAALNAKPVIHFDGVDDFLEVPDSDSLSITGDITTYFVVRMADFGTFRAVWSKGVDNLPAPNDFYALPTSGVPSYLRGDGAQSVGGVNGVQGWRENAFELAGVSSAGTLTTHYLNGRTNGTGTITAVPGDVDTPLRIGLRADSATKLSGDLAELLIYDVALSDPNRQKVELYLARKFGLGLATPLNDPPTNVALTAPAGGSSFAAPIDITLTATATDPDGAVARVEFLLNETIAAVDSTAPYSASLNFPITASPVLRVRAVDNLGLATESAPVTINVTSAVPVPLPALDHLRLWLKADAGVIQAGGAVSQWNDQSGNLNTATQTTAAQQPAFVADSLNGKPVLHFDGADDFLTVANSPTVAIQGDISSFFVAKFDDFDTYRTVWAKTLNNEPRSTDAYTLPNTGVFRVYRGGSAGIQFSDAAAPFVPGEAALIGFDQAGTTLRHYLNGSPNGEGEIPAVMEDVGTPLLIGSRADFVTRMKGDIAEIVIYDSSLSEADRGQVLTYLAQKYGIAVTPPEELPVLTITRSGNNVTLSWPSSVTGWTLESSATLAPGSWVDVQGVVNNSVTRTIASIEFFRLKK